MGCCPSTCGGWSLSASFGRSRSATENSVCKRCIQRPSPCILQSERRSGTPIRLIADSVGEEQGPARERSCVMTEADKHLTPSSVMTEHELATLGGGVVAYIKTLTSDE